MKILLAKAFPRLSSVGDLARELKRKGHDVHVLAPAPHPDHERLRCLGIPIHCLALAVSRRSPVARARGQIRVIRRTTRFLRSHAFDVVHLNLATCRLYGRLASLCANARVVSSIRGFEARYERWTNWIDGSTIAVSAAVRRYLVARGIPDGKLVTIPNGVAVGDGPRVDPHYLHRELGLRPETRLIGMVAYFRRDDLKGYATFFDAARLLNRRFPDVHFVSVGSSLSSAGATKEFFERYVDTLGLGERVHFLGERHDTLSIMDSLFAHVLPSRTEGCPMVVLEAMSRGVPNVTSQIDSIAEIVEDERSGLLVRPGDAAGLAARVAGLLDHPEVARSLGEAGRRRVTASFTASAMADGYERVFRQMAVGR